MKTIRKTALALGFALILAFLFLVPVVHYTFPPGAHSCPVNGCDFVQYGSATYQGVGVGGVWTYANGYSISVVTTAASFSASSSISYTITAEPTHTMTAVIDTTNNLELRLSLNASSSAASGVTVSVSVDDYNTLPHANNVTAANKWVLALDYTNGAPCWSDGFTVGFAIAQGYYTSSNVTAARFLDLVDPGATYNCPLYLGYGNPTGFLFQPLNDTAASYGCIGVSPSCPTGSASTGLTPSSWGTVKGYWNQGRAFTSFPRGVYSVVAEDEWGELVIAHFTVA